MYRKIMVPLDGSKLAESVIPHVETVVKGCNYPAVVFIRVIKPVQLPTGTFTDEGGSYSAEDAALVIKRSKDLTQDVIKEAKNYLDKIIGQVKLSDLNITISSEVLLETGDAANTLASYATGNDIDLIVISTHGRSGVSRMVMGSTADKILRSTCVPVLMVRAPGCGPAL